MNQILLVEDEPNVSQPLSEFLNKEGFKVSIAHNLAEAECGLSCKPNVVILDWMLPDGQGIELLKQWRARGLSVPVILLTARAELIDKVLGLELGANDYMVKPFEPRELVARIRVQLRASSSAPIADVKLENSGIVLDVKSRETYFKNRPMNLAKTEFELLRVFLQNPAQVFSREELLKQVWGYDQYPSTRTVDTHVLQLRQKTKAELFETVHGIGYRFRPDKI